jgi:hypothetical protein
LPQVDLAAVPFLFGAVSAAYVRARAPFSPLATGASFAAIVALLDGVVVAGAILHSAAIFASPLSTWVPLRVIILVRSSWEAGRRRRKRDDRGGLWGARPLLAALCSERSVLP